MKQIIIVTETNDSNESDDRYIKRFINETFDISNDYKPQFVHMDGKSKYKTNKVITKITKFINANKATKNNESPENYVIYCFDTDKINTVYTDSKALKEEEKFCSDNNYDFVWFNSTIEEVFLGHVVSDKDKKTASIRFLKDTKNPIDCSKLSSDNYTFNRQSNIKLIFSKFLPLK